MGNGDLMEFAGDAWISKAIRFFTKKDVNHTAILWHVDEFKSIKDRKFIMEALDLGIEINLMSCRLKKYEGEVYWYPLKEEYHKYRDEVAGICLLAEGRTDEIRYDYLSLVRNMWRKVNVDVKKHSFCSEFCQWVLQTAKVIEKQPKALRPGEFDKLGIYESRVKIYSWKG
jgi:hypothetical protein